MKNYLSSHTELPFHYINQTTYFMMRELVISMFDPDSKKWKWDKQKHADDIYCTTDHSKRFWTTKQQQKMNLNHNGHLMFTNSFLQINVGYKFKSKTVT